MAIVAPPLSETIPVVKEEGGVWHYYRPVKQYFRFDNNGKANAKIYGQFLPDPEHMWNARIATYNKFNAKKIGRDHAEAQPLRCRAETYALWKHWNEVKNA